MTYAEMDSLLFDVYLGKRGDATAALRNLFLNNTQRELAIAFFFDQLETVNTSLTSVADQTTYPFPTDDIHIQTIRDLTHGMDLEDKDWEWYDRRSQAADIEILERGIPEFWVIRNGLIYLEPTPDQSGYLYRTAGLQLPPAISVGVDSTLAEEWHMVVVIAAAADMLFAFKDFVTAQGIKNEALAKISAIQERRTFRRIQQSGQAVIQRIKPGRMSRTRGRGSWHEDG